MYCASVAVRKYSADNHRNIINTSDGVSAGVDECAAESLIVLVMMRTGYDALRVSTEKIQIYTLRICLQIIINQLLLAL